jgi:hypothetical protein
MVSHKGRWDKYKTDVYTAILNRKFNRSTLWEKINLTVSSSVKTFEIIRQASLLVPEELVNFVNRSF